MVNTSPGKAVLIGDNLISAEMFSERSVALREAGFTITTLSWVFEDRNEMNRRSLRIERFGPEIESPPLGLSEEIRDATILITHFAPISRDMIAAGAKLQVIGVARGGWENVNVNVATQFGIPVLHIKGRNANAVAEYTVGMILCEMRNIARSHSTMRQGEWYKIDPNSSYELANKTVGLIGFGAVGQLVARRLSRTYFKIWLTHHRMTANKQKA